MRKGHPDGMEMTRGFVVEHPPSPAPTQSPDFGLRERERRLWRMIQKSCRLAYFAWRAIEDANDPPQLFTFGDSLSWCSCRGKRSLRRCNAWQRTCSPVTSITGSSAG